MASDPVERNADTTASGSERGKSQHANEDTASGAKASALKRKSSASASSASGAIPPTQIRRTSEADDTLEANETRLTVEHWADLHEFHAWLQTPEAVRTRKDQLDRDIQVVKDLLVHPPTRAMLQSAGPSLSQKRDHQTLVVWHYRCVEQALQNFRWWQRGAFAH